MVPTIKPQMAFRRSGTLVLKVRSTSRSIAPRSNIDCNNNNNCTVTVVVVVVVLRERKFIQDKHSY